MFSRTKNDLIGSNRAKMKLKPIKPSLKVKKRYLVIEIISKEKIKDYSSVFTELWKKISQYFGEKSLGDAHIMLLKDTWNEQNQQAIIRVNHTHVDSLKAALCLVESIEKNPAIIKTITVSGILKKAKTRARIS